MFIHVKVHSLSAETPRSQDRSSTPLFYLVVASVIFPLQNKSDPGPPTPMQPPNAKKDDKVQKNARYMARRSALCVPFSMRRLSIVQDWECISRQKQVGWSTRSSGRTLTPSRAAGRNSPSGPEVVRRSRCISSAYSLLGSCTIRSGLVVWTAHGLTPGCRAAGGCPRTCRT